MNTDAVFHLPNEGEYVIASIFTTGDGVPAVAIGLVEGFFGYETKGHW